jgi:RNA polymerase sigma factor (sigma-70 family)
MAAWAPLHPQGDGRIPLRSPVSTFLFLPLLAHLQADHYGRELGEQLVQLEAECRRLVGRIGLRMGFEYAELEDLGRDFYVHLTDDGQRRLRSFPKQGNCSAWLVRCCVHFLVDLRRCRRRRAREVHCERPESLRGARESESVEDVALANIERECWRHYVASALKGVPRAERNVLALHYLAGLTHREIAEQLGCSPAAVRQRCSRAVRRVRAHLEKAPAGRL